MTREQIVSRATVLGNHIRENRGRIGCRGRDSFSKLVLFENLVAKPVVSLLKEVRFFLDRDNLGLAEKYLLEAEKEYHF